MGEVKLLTKEEKAEELGVSIRQVTNRVKKGTIKYVEGVRFQSPKKKDFRKKRLFLPENE